MSNNKLIAEFMGWTSCDSNDNTMYANPQDKSDVWSADGMRFNKSWDWLMPVVDKIECTTIDNNDNSDNFFNVMIEVFECNINGGDICICKSGNTKHKAIYKAVVEFINQLNK